MAKLTSASSTDVLEKAASNVAGMAEEDPNTGEMLTSR